MRVQDKAGPLHRAIPAQPTNGFIDEHVLPIRKVVSFDIKRLHFAAGSDRKLGGFPRQASPGRDLTRSASFAAIVHRPSPPYAA